jgi:hypothetical protein
MSVLTGETLPAFAMHLLPSYGLDSDALVGINILQLLVVRRKWSFRYPSN